MLNVQVWQDQSPNIAAFVYKELMSAVCPMGDKNSHAISAMWMLDPLRTLRKRMEQWDYAMYPVVPKHTYKLLNYICSKKTSIWAQ